MQTLKMQARVTDSFVKLLAYQSGGPGGSLNGTQRTQDVAEGTY